MTAPPESRGDGWLPIGVRPAEPMMALLFRGKYASWDFPPPRDVRFEVGWWDGETFRSLFTGHDCFEEWTEGDAQHHPTHWMPLPSAPHLKGDGE